MYTVTLFVSDKSVVSDFFVTPTGCSPSGSSVHGFLQARILEPFPTPEDLPRPGIKLMSLMSPVLTGRFFTSSANWEAPNSAQLQ